MNLQSNYVFIGSTLEYDAIATRIKEASIDVNEVEVFIISPPVPRQGPALIIRAHHSTFYHHHRDGISRENDDS